MTHPPSAPRSPRMALLVRTLATAFGLGYLPVAPGTWGSLAGLPLALWLSHLQPTLALVVLLALTGVSIAIAQAAEGAFSSAHDAKEVVIDEVIGIGWTFWALPVTWGWLTVGFLVFRWLDATKPGPIGMLDRRVSGGFGVVIDDVAAGVIACALLHLSRPYLSPVVGGW